MQRGFTLLELLVVLVIISLTASFASPALWRSYDKSQQRAEIEKFALALNEYRITAYKTGKTVELKARSDYDDEAHEKQPLPPLPEGWSIKKSTDLRFLATGVTNGAHYYIDSHNRHWLLTINPLDGEQKIRLL